MHSGGVPECPFDMEFAQLTGAAINYRVASDTLVLRLQQGHPPVPALSPAASGPLGGERAPLRAAMALALAACAGCATSSSYSEPDAPRYSGRFAAERSQPGDPTLRIVTFNIEHGRKIAEAVAGLSSHPDLRGADLLFLQEMDAPGVEVHRS